MVWFLALKSFVKGPSTLMSSLEYDQDIKVVREVNECIKKVCL